jgi:hypothetical protein
MLTLNNGTVWKALKEIAEASYPDKIALIRHFSVDVQAKESKTRHGDYTYATRGIRIFNLSRKSSHIIKTTIHELAHHLDVCFNGSSGHGVPFYTIYKHCLETAHRMGVINLADTVDAIDATDLKGLARKVGELRYEAQAARDGFIVKVDNAFAIKDQLKGRGFTFSSTEKLWIKEVAAVDVDTEKVCVVALAGEKNVRIVGRDSNTIDSVYFAILGKKDLFDKKDDLKTFGCKYDSARGWYKRIQANEKKDFTNAVVRQFGITPSFTGSL